MTEASAAPAAPAPPVPVEPAPASAPRSLWGDAWRRLLKNRFAVLSLVWLAIIGLLATLAPWVVPIDPQHQEWWIGKRGPLYKHATLENVMAFAPGTPLPEPFPATSHDVALRTLEVHKRDARIEIDRAGKVVRIELMPDYDADNPEDETPDVLDVQAPAHLVIEGKPPFSELKIEKGKVAPLELGRPADGERTVVGELRRGEKTHDLAATVASGKVAKLTLDGKPVDSQQVSAEAVLAATVDGAPFEHTHLLGTDDSGRDILSRVIFGGRISLLVGIVATLVSLVIGVVYGATSGYAGGRTDEVLMRIVDILYAIPFMFFVIILLVLFGRNLILLFVAIGAVEWLTMARIVRGQVLSLKEKEFVEAARVSGTSNSGIVFGHLIPNSLGAVIVYTTLTIPEVILTEAFLSFLGLSVQYNGQNLESWGSLTKTGMDLALGGFPWLLLWSSLALSLTLFALNFLGDGLRDALDPRLRGRG